MCVPLSTDSRSLCFVFSNVCGALSGCFSRVRDPLKINRLLLIYREMLTSEAVRGVGNHVDEQATARPGANFRVADPELIAVLTS